MTLTCEQIANALHVAFDLPDFEQFLNLNRNLRLEDYSGKYDTFPVALSKVLVAVAKKGSLVDFVKSASNVRSRNPDLLDCCDEEALTLIQADLANDDPEASGSLHAWLDSFNATSDVPSPAAGIQWYELATRVFGDSKDANTEHVKRSFLRDAFKMAFQKLPITGDIATTRKLSMDRLDVAYVQSQVAVVKFIRFTIPKGARHVRIPSNRLIDDGGKWFIPPTAAFIRRPDTFKRRHINDLVDSDQPRWPLTEDDEGAELFSVTVYENEHFFPIAGKGDNSGAVIGDLAGRVKRLNFCIGGSFREIGIAGFYELPQKSPMMFGTINEANIQPIDTQSHVIHAFTELIQHLQLQIDATDQEKYEWQVATEAWQQVATGQWAGAGIADVSNDVMLHLAGSLSADVVQQ